MIFLDGYYLFYFVFLIVFVIFLKKMFQILLDLKANCLKFAYKSFF